jgi:glutathione S-transferase
MPFGKPGPVRPGAGRLKPAISVFVPERPPACSGLAGFLYLAGSTIRLPDYLLYVILTWDRMLDRPLVEDYPRLAAYRQRVGARPAIQRAQAREAAALAPA